MEQQQHDFSDLKPRTGIDRLQKSENSSISALQLIKLAPKSPEKLYSCLVQKNKIIFSHFFFRLSKQF